MSREMESNPNLPHYPIVGGSKPLAFTKKDDVYHGQTSAWIGDTLLWVSPDEEITKLHVGKINAFAEAWKNASTKEKFDSLRAEVEELKERSKNFGEHYERMIGLPCRKCGELQAEVKRIKEESDILEASQDERTKEAIELAVQRFEEDERKAVEKNGMRQIDRFQAILNRLRNKTKVWIGDGIFGVDWSCNGIGFGGFSFTIEDNAKPVAKGCCPSGRLKVLDSEYMNRDFLKAVLCRLIDEAIWDHEGAMEEE